MIVVVLPGCKHGPRVVERREFGYVQAFIAEPAVKRLAKPVLDGLSRPNKVELHATLPRPFVQCSRGEFGPVIHGDALGNGRRWAT